MDLLSPAPFWPIADGLPANFPTLRNDVDCDVLVVGAGVSGALVAWLLTSAGLATAVLDKREAAHGSTAGSTSLLQYEIDTPLCELSDRLGPRHAARCYRRSREAVRAIGRMVRKLRIDCGHEEKASLFLASRPGHLGLLRREFECRREAGLAVEWWPRSRIRSESSLDYPGAILSSDGAQIDAYRLTYGLLSAAAGKGCLVCDRSPVTNIRHTGKTVEARAGAGYRIRARHLVVASGYEASVLLPGRLTQLRSTFAAISEPAESFSGWPADRCLIWETRDPYVYLRTTPEGRIIIGGGDEDFQDPVARDKLVSAKAEMLARRFRRMFPRIRFEPAYAWAGTFAHTADGLPFIGRHPATPRTWFALGYGGNGITFSLIAAELIRDQILDRPNSDGRLFGFERLTAAAPPRVRWRMPG